MRRAEDGGWLLELNPETLPRVLVNRGFYARCQVGVRNKDDKVFLAEKLQSANWLLKSLEQRANTIIKVAQMHESTVSRVTANKYIATPRGTFELKYFFTTAIAGTHGGEQHSAEAV